MEALKKKLSAKLKQNGGFTLVEMLIVVAIIAILMMVSIPLVNTSLEKARLAVDRANARDAISLATIEVLGDSITEKTYWSYKVNSDHTGYLDSKSTTSAPTDGVEGQSKELKKDSKKLSVTFDPDGNDGKGSYETSFDSVVNPTP